MYITVIGVYLHKELSVTDIYRNEKLAILFSVLYVCVFKLTKTN